MQSLNGRSFRALGAVVCIALASLVLVAAILIGFRGPSQVGASSHREAPLITADPYADTTDVYAFVSPDVTSTVTLVGSWVPLEEPTGGPNFYKFADDVLYELHVDNVGDARSHIRYQFTFHTVVNNPNTFLYNTGPITNLNSPGWNVRQFYTVTEVVSPTSGSVVTTVLFSNRLAPPVNIGSKSTPNYQALSDAAIYSLATPAGNIKVFAGQTDDPFWVDLGSVFDLLTLRGNPVPAVGYSTGPNIPLDGLSGYNVHSIAIQVPTARVLSGTVPATNTVIGVWATSSRGGVQVSRLGMPLVNEAVLPLALKDVFNGLRPEDDLGAYLAVPLLQESVEDPELGNLLCLLYGVPLPRDTGLDCDTDYTTPGSGRADIFEIFLTGIKTGAVFTITTPAGPVALPANTNVNQFSAVSAQPAEMIRLNTALRPGELCAPTPNYQFGLLAGDACGFPNGRRLADDVTDIELLAVAGAAWTPVTGDTSFSMNPIYFSVLTDGLPRNDVPFRSTFPYLALPHSGQARIHTYTVFNYFAIVLKNAMLSLMQSR